MENRSFDHYFGWLRDADGKQRQSYPDATGQQVPTRHFSTLGTGGTQYKGCGHPDPGTAGTSGRAQLQRRLPGARLRQRRVRAHLLQPGRPGLHPRGRPQLHLYDRYFCSFLASTWPNRYYKWSAQSGGLKTQHDRARRQQLGDHLRPRDRPRPDARATTPPTCPSRPCSAGAPAAWINPISRYYEDCFTGTLPNISIVDPAVQRRRRAATGCRRTSTRSATCGWVRRSWRTW